MRKHRRARDAEVEHFDVAGGGDLDIGGLDIAVNDAVAVRFGQRRSHARGDFQGLVRRSFGARRGGARKLAPETSSMAMNGSPSGVLDELVDVRDVGVRERRGRAGFLQQVGAQFLVARGRWSRT